MDLHVTWQLNSVVDEKNEWNCYLHDHGKRERIRLLVTRSWKILWARGNEAWSEIILRNDLCLWRMVSNQTPFPSTPSYVWVEKNVGEKHFDLIQKQRRGLFDFDLAMHWFFMGPYIREDGECVGSENGVSHMSWLPHLVKLFTQILSVYYTIIYLGF